MAITIQDYRVKISLYHATGKNLQIKFKNTTTKPTKQTTSIIILILIMFDFFSNKNPPILIKSSYHCNSTMSYPNTPSLAIIWESISINSCNHAHCMLNWSYSAPSNNSISHALFGNRRRLGYKLSIWNCRKGLISNRDFDTPTVVDIKRFVEKNRPHIFGIIESNLHSVKSRCEWKRKVTQKEIEDKLKIDGYNIELPDTWDAYGQARILVYVSEDLNYKRKFMDPNFKDLPNVTLEIGLGREKKS